MALRGIKPTAVRKRLKALFYGIAGSGKTTACLAFPRPYLIDCERGAENDQYVRLLEKNGGSLFQTSDFDELIKEVSSLLSEKHQYKTLIIDPLTPVYNGLLDKFSIDEKVGAGFGRHYSEAAKHMKRLFDLLLRLDMNVIITSHAKAEYKIEGKEMILIGNTFDCYKKLDYLFDLVIEIQKRHNDRIAIVKKTRIESFSETEHFSFNYASFSDKYGKDILEKDMVPEELASSDDIKELTRLILALQVSEETIQKAYAKSKSSSFNEMPKTFITKWIESLQAREITASKENMNDY